MAIRIYRCLHCRQAVTTTYEPGYGTRWIHVDGLYECRPTYAAPNFNDPVED